MGNFALFAETPRASGVGHRFLVATNDQTPEKRVAEFLKSVNQDLSFGENYIGVARSVQQHSGSSVRIGREIIMLVGVDFARISAPIRNQTQLILQEVLDSVERLVLHEINWSLLPRADLLVRRPELSLWLNKFQHLDLPETDRIHGPRPLKPANPQTDSRPNTIEKSKWSKLKLALALFAIILVTTWWYQSTSDFGGTRNAKRMENVENIKGQTTEKKENPLAKLAKEWGCSQEEVVHSIHRAKNWDQRKKTDQLSANDVRNDLEVMRLIEKLTKANNIDRIFISHEIEKSNKNEFRLIIQEYDIKRDSDVILLRKWLYEFWKKWTIQHNEWLEAEKILEKMELGEDNLPRILREIGQMSPDEGMGVGFVEPKTPLFDRQDIMILELLKKCLGALNKNNICDLFGNQSPSSPQYEHLFTLTMIQKNWEKRIKPEIDKSRKEMVDQARANQEQGEKQSKNNAEKLYKYYRDFESLIKHCCDHYKSEIKQDK